MGSDRFSDDFITKLVDETLKGVGHLDDKKESKKRDHYFEKKRTGKRLSKGLVNSVKIFCEEHNIFYAQGELEAISQCFRFYFKDEEWCVPSNWGIFEHGLSVKKVGLFCKVDKKEPSYFLEVVSKHMAQKFTQLYCFKEKDDYILIFLNRFHLKMHGQFFEDVCDHESVAAKIKKAS